MSALTIKSVMSVCCLLAAAGLPGAPAQAYANPATPMSVIEASAGQLCAAIDQDPTAPGIRAGMRGLQKQGLDPLDGALVLLTAVHHVCPQYDELVTESLPGAPAGEACPKRW